MAVTINVPNIGDVVVDGIASESTLKQLVSAINGIKNTGGGGGTSGGSGSGGSLKGTGAVESSLDSLSFAVGAVAGKLTKSAEVLDSIVRKQSAIANLQGSALSEATDEIFIFGRFLSRYTEQIDRNIRAFQTASQAGASFGGQILEVSVAAGNAGLNLQDFAGLLKSNGDALRLLSGNTAEGARRFAELGRQLRASEVANDLANLGFTTQDINQGLANYISIVNRVGIRQNRTNQEYVSGTVSYLKELDLLAKVTGQTREEAQRRNEDLAADAAFQSQLNSMIASGREADAENLRLFINQFDDPTLRTALKEIVISGTASGEASRKLVPFLGEAGVAAMEAGRALDQTGRFSLETANSLTNLTIQSARQSSAQVSTIGQFGVLGDEINALTDAGRRQENSLIDAVRAQQEATSTTDALAEVSKRFLERVNELSNMFSRLMADSGILPDVMDMFDSITGFLRQFIDPLISVTSFFTSLLVPLFDLVEFFGKVIRVALQPFMIILDSITGAIRKLTSGFEDITDAGSQLDAALIDMGIFFTNAMFTIGDALFFLRDSFMDAALAFMSLFRSAEENEAAQQAQQRYREDRDNRREQSRLQYIKKLENSILGETEIRNANNASLLDYSSPDQLLKTFAEQQGSYLAGDTATDVTSAAGGRGTTTQTGIFGNDLTMATYESELAGSSGTRGFGSLKDLFDFKFPSMPEWLTDEYWIAQGQVAREHINEAFTSTFNWVDDIGTRMYNSLQEGWKMFTNWIPSGSDIVDATTDAASSAWDSVTSWFSDDETASANGNRSKTMEEIVAMAKNLDPENKMTEETMKQLIAEITKATGGSTGSTAQGGSPTNADDLNTTSVSQLVAVLTEQLRLSKQQIDAIKALSGNVYAGT